MSHARPPISRRGFVTAVATGVAATACGSLPRSGTSARTLRVGHTGITWGYAPARAEQAIRDVGTLGYHGFESFGSVLDWWDTRGTLQPHLAAAGLVLVSAYCPFDLTKAAARRDEIAKARRWGALIKKHGGRIAVMGPNNVTRQSFDFRMHRSDIVSALNDLGTALRDVGVVGALHQHTGSCIESRDELYAVMESVDTRVVTLAPDLGELLQGGVDPVKAVSDFLPLVRHVHIKDFDGGSVHEGYCPVGKGRVDVPAVVSVLERARPDLMMMVELNPPAQGTGYAPLEAARMSRDYLRTLGYAFR